MLKTLLTLALLALTACSTLPGTPRRLLAADDAWTARAALARAEATRPRGMLEAWELRRPAEFNRVDD